MVKSRLQNMHTRHSFLPSNRLFQAMQRALSLALLLALLLSACAATPQPAPSGKPQVLAVESFLADITHAVAGERATVTSLIPDGMDPHAFEPTPRDVVRIATSPLLVVNGAGLESWLQRTLTNTSRAILVVDASSGIPPRKPAPGENVDEATDPHFWLDPILVKTYAENICQGLIQLDPAGAEIYQANLTAYQAQLDELDAWIRAQVAPIPTSRRLLITNHESFGYFADRYGFQVVGTIIPSVSTGAMPTARQLASLIEQIKTTGAPAIFLEAGTNPQLAETVAREAGVSIVTGLLTHSLTSPGGPAPTYLSMMRYDTLMIVDALK